jgi:hypothetical protein
MVGIIPLDGFQDNWQLPYAPYLAPIADGITLVENAILHCAFVGCKQIFIVCEERSVRMLRKHLGEWVEDPAWWYRKTFTPNAYRLQIPIFYIRMTEKDKRQRGSAAWGIIHAARVANKMAANVSKWTMPSRFFVSFPWSGINFWEFKQHRRATATTRNFYFTHKGESAWTNEYIPFAFNQDDLRAMKRNFAAKTTLTYKKIAEFIPNDRSWFERLPVEEQHSGRRFTIQQLLEPVNNDSYKSLEINKYYNVYTWEGLREAISDFQFRRPKRRYLQTEQGSRILQRIGVNTDE